MRRAPASLKVGSRLFSQLERPVRGAERGIQNPRAPKRRRGAERAEAGAPEKGTRPELSRTLAWQ